MQVVGMLTSIDFEILSILTAKVDPENCRSISRRFTKKSVKYRENGEKAMKDMNIIDSL